MLHLGTDSHTNGWKAVTRIAITGSTKSCKVKLLNMDISSVTEKSCFLHCLRECHLGTDALGITFFHIHHAEYINIWCIRIGVKCRISLICLIIINHLSNGNRCRSHNTVSTVIICIYGRIDSIYYLRSFCRLCQHETCCQH